MSQSTTTLVLSLEREWNRYLIVISARYATTSEDVDELYQDGLLLLHELSQYYATDSDDFRKLFKTSFINHCKSHFFKESAQKRDYRLKVALETPATDGDDESSNGGLHPGVVHDWYSRFNDTFSEIDYVNSFLQCLTEDDRRLVSELMDPCESILSKWDQYSLEYQRVPSSIPLYVYAEYFEVSEKSIRRSLNRIRIAYISYTGDESLKQFITKL